MRLGNKGASSGKSSGKGKFGKLSKGKILNLNRDDSKNSKTMKTIISESNEILYHPKTKLVEFFAHEGLLGTARNVDNMDIRKVAKNLGKNYTQAW